MLIITHASHLDHTLTTAQLKHALSTFSAKEGFFIESLVLPDELGRVPCGLYGPIVGDPPVSEDVVTYQRRGDRLYESRMVPKLAHRQRTTNVVTVIAGPNDGQTCVLYTIFGGPIAPKEVNDPTLKEGEREESVKFWREHALAF